MQVIVHYGNFHYLGIQAGDSLHTNGHQDGLLPVHIRRCEKNHIWPEQRLRNKQLIQSGYYQCSAIFDIQWIIRRKQIVFFVF